jgi:hypothetical protein
MKRTADLAAGTFSVCLFPTSLPYIEGGPPTERLLLALRYTPGMLSPLFDLLISQLEKTDDFTERLALKVACGILIQRQVDLFQNPPDPRIALTEEDFEWTPEKIELINGIIPWPTPENRAEDYDMRDEYLAADAQRKEEIRKILRDPTDEMEAISEAKWRRRSHHG